MKTGLSLIRCVVSLSLAVFVVGAIVARVSGQDAKKYVKDALDSRFELPDSSDSDYSSKRSVVNRELATLEATFKKVLKSGNDLGSNQAEVDRFMGGYFLPRMTHYDDIDLSFGLERDRLLREYLAKATNTGARDYVLDSLLLPFAKKVCEGNYHPAARINAMYIVANLNRREGTSVSSGAGRNKRPPTAMTEALAYMIQTIDSVTQPAYLKVAALQGIERQTGLDQLAQKQINQPTRDGIRDRMLKLVQQPYSGKANEDDLLYFQQRIATRVIGNLADPGAANAVALQLKSMIANEKLRLWLRHDAIASFGKLNFTKNAAAQALIKETINDAVNFVAKLASQRADYINREVVLLMENVLVYTGKDIAKLGTPNTEDTQLRRASASAEQGFQRDQESESKPKIHVNLPNYRLNLLRREFKIVANSVAIAINGKDSKSIAGLAASLNLADRREAYNMTVALRLQINQLDKQLYLSDDELPSTTMRLRDNFRTAAEQLSKLPWIIEHHKESLKRLGKKNGDS